MVHTDPQESLLDDLLISRMESLHVDDPMSSDTLLNHPTEAIESFGIPSDDDLVERAQEPEVADESQVAEGADTVEESTESVDQRMSILRNTIRMVEHKPEEGDLATIHFLRKMLEKLRLEKVEQRESLVQRTMEQFFTPV